MISSNKRVEKYMARYSEHRGVVVKKYRNLLGKCVLVLDENNILIKVNVGKTLYQVIEIGCKLTIGKIGRKLINIRPGFAKNID